MLGRTHALSGPVVAVAALPAVNQILAWAGRGQVDGMLLIPYLVGAAGGAMLPDSDHPSATVAQSLGPVTKILCRVMGTVSGGHRQGTHSVAGVAFFVAVTYLVAMWNPWAYGGWLAFLAAFASAAMFRQFTKQTAIVHTLTVLAAGAGLAWLAGLSLFPVDAVAAGVGAGCVAHILGDMLTKEGCPLLWPVSKVRVSLLPLTTGHGWETVAQAVLVALFPVLLFFSDTTVGVWLRSLL